MTDNELVEKIVAIYGSRGLTWSDLTDQEARMVELLRDAHWLVVDKHGEIHLACGSY